MRKYVHGILTVKDKEWASLAIAERIEAMVEVLEGIGKDLHEIAQNTRRSEA